MNKKLIYTLVVIICLSLLVNLSLLFTVDYVDSEWNDLYIKNDLEWCGSINDLIDQNDRLLLHLQSYDEAYYELNNLGKLDC